MSANCIVSCPFSSSHCLCAIRSVCPQMWTCLATFQIWSDFILVKTDFGRISWLLFLPIAAAPLQQTVWHHFFTFWWFLFRAVTIIFHAIQVFIDLGFHWSQRFGLLFLTCFQMHCCPCLCMHPLIQSLDNLKWSSWLGLQDWWGTFVLRQHSIPIESQTHQWLTCLNWARHQWHTTWNCPNWQCALKQTKICDAAKSVVPHSNHRNHKNGALQFGQLQNDLTWTLMTCKMVQCLLGFHCKMHKLKALDMQAVHQKCFKVGVQNCFADGHSKNLKHKATRWKCCMWRCQATRPRQFVQKLLNCRTVAKTFLVNPKQMINSSNAINNVFRCHLNSVHVKLWQSVCGAAQKTRKWSVEQKKSMINICRHHFCLADFWPWTHTDNSKDAQFHLSQKCWSQKMAQFCQTSQFLFLNMLLSFSSLNSGVWSWLLGMHVSCWCRTKQHASSVFFVLSQNNWLCTLSAKPDC